MDNLGRNLLQYFDSINLRDARGELYQKIDAIENEANVYYLVSLSNLKNILDDGGIKCRNDIFKEGIDLSGHGVQTMRDKIIDLGRDEDIINKKIHDCINFFFNPINSTFSAFQRNALLKDFAHDTYGIVCIIEMRMSDFFKTDNMYWSISNMNLASRNCDLGFLKKDYESFDWKSIFQKKENNMNKGNSAEFIVFYKNTNSVVSHLIPIRFIRRILVSEQHEVNVRKTIPAVQNKIYILNNNIFRDKTELLHYERKLIKHNIMNLHEIGISIEKFCDFFNTFSEFSKQLGISLSEEYFETSYMANSYHGIGHTIRVMFWIHVLCYLSNINRKEEETAQYAAFIHDLCRDKNYEDKIHGLKAVSKYKCLLEKHVQHDQIDNCKIAVVFHCEDDTKFRNKSLIWDLLKDADSLDRGRFGHPQGLNNIIKNSNGCDVNYLRLSVLKNSMKLKEKLAWMAHWLAQITHHTDWKEDPFINFKNEIKASLNACLMNDILEPNEKIIVKEIVDNI